jgi:hypothetical protein
MTKTTNTFRKALAVAIAVSFVTGTSGCATKGANVTSSYVAQGTYDKATCATLARDIIDAQQHASALSGQLDSAADKDAAVVAVTLLLFWPAIFFVSGGDKEKQAELASVKGQFEAMNKVYKSKGCVA